MTGFAASSPHLPVWHRLFMVICLMLGVAATVDAAVVRTFNSTDVPATIPEVANPPGSQAGNTRSTVAVYGIVGSITKVTISMYITHEYTSDLAIRLVPPVPATGAANPGDGILIADDIYSTAVPADPGDPDQTPQTSGDNAYGGATSGFGTSNAAPGPTGGRVAFDDAGVAINRANPNIVNNVRFNVYLKSGTYQPITALATLNGLSGLAVNGTWTLLVQDQAGLDQGSIRSWSITITEAGPHIWKGGGADFEWSTAANWEDDNAPGPNERNALVIFPDANVANRTPTKSNLPNLTVGNLQIAEGYTLGGAASIIMGNPSTITVLAGTGANVAAPINVANPILLQGATTVTAGTGTTLNLNSAINNDATVIATGGALTKTGVGRVFLGGGNGYTGVTTVSAGILSFDEATGLGTAAGGTVVTNGATLELTGAGATVATEPLTLAGTGTAGQGALLGTAACIWNGPVTLSANVTNGVGGTVTLGSFAAATNERTLAALGAGTVTLTGVLPAGAKTNLQVNGGTLVNTVAQANVGDLDLNGGTITPTGTITVADAIHVSGTAAGSTLGAGTINLNGGGRSLSVGDGTALNDLTVAAGLVFSNGGLNKSGNGTLLWNNSASPTIYLSISRGVLTGRGTVGNLSIGRAKLAPDGGAFNVTNLTLSDDSWLAFNGSQVAATGTASMAGGILQPLVANGTVISTGAGTTGEFAFYSRTAGVPVSYAGNNVVFTATGGNSASFAPTTSYSGKEHGPSIQLTVTAGGGMDIAIISGGGDFSPGSDFDTISLASIVAGANAITLNITDDFIAEGTESGNIIIIPLTGGFAGSPGSATLTISDNDGDDQRTCGFGTGLTVFLLLGFALALRARLRRP